MSKKKGGKLKWVVLAVVAIGVIGAIGGNSDSNTTSSSNTSAKTESVKETDTPTPIEYTAVSVNDMMSQLDDNALGASDKYKGQYLEITGRLGNIDSSGKYISLYPDDEYAIIGVLVSTTHECLFGKDSKSEPRPVLRMVPRTATR